MASTLQSDCRKDFGKVAAQVAVLYFVLIEILKAFMSAQVVKDFNAHDLTLGQAGLVGSVSAARGGQQVGC